MGLKIRPNFDTAGSGWSTLRSAVNLKSASASIDNPRAASPLSAGVATTLHATDRSPSYNFKLVWPFSLSCGNISSSLIHVHLLVQSFESRSNAVSLFPSSLRRASPRTRKHGRRLNHFRRTFSPSFVSRFGGQTPRTKSLTVVNVIFLIISTLALCLRLFTRIHVIRLFGIDDCKQFLISLHADCSKLLCGYIS